MGTALLVFATCFVAYANGANDNFKGVAAVYGSGVANYRVALAWATAVTVAGSIASIYFAQALLAKFSGHGIVPDGIAASVQFLLAVSIGAGSTVILATRFGFPVSTTHALVGAIIGAGWGAVGLAGTNLSSLGGGFIVPLLLSPLLAMTLGAVMSVISHGARGWFRLPEACVCVGIEEQLALGSQCNSAIGLRGGPGLTLAIRSCDAARRKQRNPGMAHIDGNVLLSAGHFFSAGLVSFARSLNDTPKIAALLLLVPWISPDATIWLVAVAMTIGGLLGARRVAETMAHKITAIDPVRGLVANVATGTLVILASTLGLPVSTTHVSVGSLFGIALTTGQASTATVTAVVLSWFVTLPCAVTIGSLSYIAMDWLS